MSLSANELQAIQNLKSQIPETQKSQVPTQSAETQEPSQQQILTEASAEDLFFVLENSLGEINVLVDELLKKPEVKDEHTIGFLTTMKGSLIGMIRDVISIKQGSYRNPEQTSEIPAEQESYIKPQIMPGESLKAKRNLQPGESFVAPAMNELYR